MKLHTSLPPHGTARKIWQVFEANGWIVEELHYNPNCWGGGAIDGWGRWSITASNPNVQGDDREFGYFCYVRARRVVIVQTICAPCNTRLVGYVSKECPFHYHHPERCKYNSMTDEMPPDSCMGKCLDMPDDMLIEMCEIFEKVYGKDAFQRHMIRYREKQHNGGGEEMS